MEGEQRAYRELGGFFGKVGLLDSRFKNFRDQRVPAFLIKSPELIPTKDPDRDDCLPGQFEKIAPAAKGRVGVAAQFLESGETASLHADEHFPMHSVYKLPISMAVLQRLDRGELKLDHCESRAQRFRAKGNV